jgi:hypothetical protein
MRESRTQCMKLDRFFIVLNPDPLLLGALPPYPQEGQERQGAGGMEGEGQGRGQRKGKEKGRGMGGGKENGVGGRD